MAETVIVGIGNPYRGDDAAGWAVIDGLAKAAGPTLSLRKMQGDIAELIDIFAEYKNVYLVDACSSDVLNDDGWLRIDANKEPIVDNSHQTSTHGFSLSQAISLARNIGQLPNKLIVYAINGKQFSVSDELSPSVEKSIDLVVKAILNEEDVKHA